LESRKSKKITKGERIDFELRFKIPMEPPNDILTEAISTTKQSEMGL
jgi:hypothetical protein